LTAQQDADDLLDMEDVSGKRTIATRFQTHVVLREENVAAALEVMSRFAVDPRWLIYLPPTMSPSETSLREGLLEHPEDAFAYYAKAGVDRVVIEEKHMGSRAIIVVCRDGDAARARFGVSGATRGAIYTRTGRSFFSDHLITQSVLDRLVASLDRADFWQRFDTTWACLDAEIMPWSAKAQTLIDEQYAPVGAAAIAGLSAATQLLATAVDRGVDAQALLSRFEMRKGTAFQYDAVWRRYAWDVESVDDLRVAPFHILATEGAVHDDKSHAWHMETLAEVCTRSDEILAPTSWRELDPNDQSEVASAIDWWRELTLGGGEGVVVKPSLFVARDGKRLVQPALKCRGQEYLRMIYGPEYTLPEHLDRLRTRGLGSKRKLAISEFSLGLEALHRFVERAPLRRVHECVFGVLALESEPIDPRL
jgi:protein phosphatase